MSDTVATAGDRDSILPRLAAGTLVAAVAACFVAQIGVSIPATTQGYINQDLHISSTTLTWVSDAFLVPATVLELSFGVVGDLFGRKRLLAIGAALMTLGGLLSFLKPENHGASLLLTGQVVSGIGAAALFPTSIAMIAVPLLVVGAGFKIAVTAITVVAVDSVPISTAGMASGATSMLRDFGPTLGPAIVTAIALTSAANAINAQIAASPSLHSALNAFNSSSQIPPPLKAAVNSGPLGANAIPDPPNPLKDVAFQALSHGYGLGYLVCGIAARVAALIAALMLGGRAHTDAFTDVAEMAGSR